MRWAWLKTTIMLSKLISHLARILDIDALPDSSIVLSALKLHLAMDARWAQMVSWTQLPLLPLHYLASFNLKFAQILSLIPMESILETTIIVKQDLFTNYYRITINWGTIQVLENVFYTKVSRIRQLTNSPKFTVLLVLKQRKNSSLVLKWQISMVTQQGCLLHRKIQPY